MTGSRTRDLLQRYQEPLLSALLLGVSRLNWHLGFLAFFALIPLFTFFENRSRSHAKILPASIWFSLIYTFIALHWVAFTAQHASVPKWSEIPVGIGMFVGIAFLFSLYFYILFGLIDAAWKGARGFRLLAVMGLWVGFEWIQNYGDFHFPWHNLGYALSEYTILLQVAELGGVYLVSILIIAVNWMLFKSYRRPEKYMTLLSILMLIWLVYGGIRLYGLPTRETDTRVAVLQPNIPQELKWNRAYLDSTLSIYEDMTREAHQDSADLILYPESGIPLYLLSSPRRFNPVQNLCNELDASIFTGFPYLEKAPQGSHEEYNYFNSCTQFKPNGMHDPPYHKRALVPFGERTPWLKTFPFLWSIQLGQANFQPGDSTGHYSVDGIDYSPLICFEIALPHLTCDISQGGGQFIVNLTNDGWFGHTVGTYQHAMMAKFRAIETRRQIFRAANSGISMIVQPTGRISSRLGLYKKGMLEAPVSLYEGRSPYCRWMYLLPPILGALGLFLGLVALTRNLTLSDYKALHKDL